MIFKNEFFLTFWGLLFPTNDEETKKFRFFLLGKLTKLAPGLVSLDFPWLNVFWMIFKRFARFAIGFEEGRWSHVFFSLLSVGDDGEENEDWENGHGGRSKDGRGVEVMPRGATSSSP